ncbi:MAG: hypothetical protein WCI74_01405 [Actinomycetes bacterium]
MTGLGTTQETGILSAWRLALASSGFDVILRIDAPELWDDIVDRSAFAEVGFLANEIDYQLEYWASRVSRLEDLSVILRCSGQAYGVWPLNYWEADGVPRIGSIPSGVREPLTVAGPGMPTTAKTARSAQRAIDTFTNELTDVDYWIAEAGVRPEIGLSQWHVQAVETAREIVVGHELYVDLGLEIGAIQRRFRKGTRSSLRVALAEWTAEIVSTPDERAWEDFKNLHMTVAGRQTRSDRTWQIQLDGISKGRAFLITLRRPDSQLVGAALFSHTPSVGRYQVAAYDRSLFDKPIGHAAQLGAITELKRRGVRWYGIGTKRGPYERPEPSEKEIAISHFKSGFATHTFASYSIKRPVGHSVGGAR